MYKYFKNFLFLLFIIPNFAFSQSIDLYNQGKFNSAFREAFKQSKAGEKEGDFILGKIYFFGNGAAKKNLTKSLLYFNKAIKNKSVRAATFLAKQYKSGKYLKQNYAESRRLFILANKLGGGDFSKEVAFLSQQLSDDQLTKTSCVDAKLAAEKNDRTNYLYYIRCMLQEEGVSKDIDKINKLIKKLTENPKEEEIYILSSILIEGPSEVKNPLLAYTTLENYLTKKQINSNLKIKLVKQLNNIKFTVENCIKSLKKNSNIQIRFVCGKVEESNNPKSLISLFEIYEKNINIFDNYDDKKIKILKKAIFYNNSEALDKLESYFIQNSEIDKFLDFLSINIHDNKFNSKMKVVFKNKIRDINSNLIEDLDLVNLETIHRSISNHNCDLLNKFTEKVKLKYVTDLSKKINLNTIKCKKSKGLKLLKSIYDQNDLNLNKAFNTLSELCSENVTHSCFVLSKMYLANKLPKSQDFLNEEDKILTAIDLLNRSIDNGNIEAYIPLAELMLTKNKNVKKANSLLEIAISKGEYDALYLKSWYAIKQRGIFSGSKKTCQPLRDFLSKNVTSSQYYSKAIKLYNKKCK